MIEGVPPGRSNLINVYCVLPAPNPSQGQGLSWEEMDISISPPPPAHLYELLAHPETVIDSPRGCWATI